MYFLEPDLYRLLELILMLPSELPWCVGNFMGNRSNFIQTKLSPRAFVHPNGGEPFVTITYPSFEDSS